MQEIMGTLTNNDTVLSGQGGIAFIARILSREEHRCVKDGNISYSSGHYCIFRVASVSIYAAKIVRQFPVMCVSIVLDLLNSYIHKYLK